MIGYFVDRPRIQMLMHTRCCKNRCIVNVIKNVVEYITTEYPFYPKIKHILICNPNQSTCVHVELML